MRVAINLLTEDPHNPSGAHWFWTRIVPEMAHRLGPGEELHLILSPESRRAHPDYGDAVRYITFPWSNERRVLRTASEHLLSPIRLPLSHIDVLNTSVAPLMNPSWDLVIHIKTMHAFTTPEALSMGARAYRRLTYQRSARLAGAIIINSNSLRREIDQYLEVEPEKIRLIPEAVDHAVFKPGDRDAARANVASFGISRPFVLFVSSLWRYKNCHGLLNAWKRARPELAGRQLVIVGAERDEHTLLNCTVSLTNSGSETMLSSSAVCHWRTLLASIKRRTSSCTPRSMRLSGCRFSRPWLARARSSPPTSAAMPDTAGGAALLADPHDPAALARALLDACGSGADTLRTLGLRRAQQFTWGATASATLDVYREVAERRRQRR